MPRVRMNGWDPQPGAEPLTREVEVPRPGAPRPLPNGRRPKLMDSGRAARKGLKKYFLTRSVQKITFTHSILKKRSGSRISTPKCASRNPKHTGTRIPKRNHGAAIVTYFVQRAQVMAQTDASSLRARERGCQNGRRVARGRPSGWDSSKIRPPDCRPECSDTIMLECTFPEYSARDHAGALVLRRNCTVPLLRCVL